LSATPTRTEQFYQVLRQRHGSRLDGCLLPPPSFISMQGEILAFDEQAGTLSVRFPIQESQLNAYHTLQGGFLAAAVDSTFGPLGLLVAPPNVTRRMELTYSLPATLEMGSIQVHARLTSRSGQMLELSADVRDPQGKRLARAKATHWIIQPVAEPPGL